MFEREQETMSEAFDQVRSPVFTALVSQKPIVGSCRTRGNRRGGERQFRKPSNFMSGVRNGRGSWH